MLIAIVEIVMLFLLKVRIFLISGIIALVIGRIVTHYKIKSEIRAVFSVILIITFCFIGSSLNWSGVYLRSFDYTLSTLSNSGNEVEPTIAASEDEDDSGFLPEFPVYPGEALEVGTQGESVALMNDLTSDGIYGNMTKSAVEKFQSYAGIEVNGVVDANTWDVIMQYEYGAYY